MEDIEKAFERPEDIDYLQSQVLGDQEKDVEMDEFEKMDDSEYENE